MSIFQKLPFADPYDGAIILPMGDVSPIFPAPLPDPESDALAQWEFGPGSASLLSLVNSQSLTPVSSSNLPHYSDNFLTLVSGGLYGLSSEIPDTGPAWTHWAVVQYKTSGGVLFGTSTSDSGAGGGMLWINSSNGYLTSTIRGFSSGIAKVPSGIVDGNWIFVALSMSSTGMIIYIANSDVVTVSGTYFAPTTTRYHTVGNGNHAGANFYPGLNHAAHGIHSSSKTITQLDGIYKRVKQRLSSRGISVL